jgi:hypothetical protein
MIRGVWMSALAASCVAAAYGLAMLSVLGAPPLGLLLTDRIRAALTLVPRRWRASETTL